MNIIDETKFLDRVVSLIKRKSTGNVEEFASKLDMSVRSLQRLIQKMKEEGFPIAFCKYSNSYYFTRQVTYEFRITVGNDDLLKVRGGYMPNMNLMGFENSYDLFSKS